MPPPTAAIIALGCPKNQVDSEETAAALVKAGYALTTDRRQADIVVLTTCAFIRAAVDESVAASRNLVDSRRSNPGQKVIVAGCLVERFRRRVKRMIPGADLYVGLNALTDVPHLLARAATGLQLTSVGPRRRYSRLLSTPNHYAYLRIADGCDNHCAYCTIPLIRGPYRSRPVGELLAEARSLARLGVRELVLIAQDTTAYGSDLTRSTGLPLLLRRLAAVPGIRWLRLMYAHPARITDSLLREFERNPSLCRYIDLPIQHISDRILERMNRRCSRRDIERALRALRAIPGLAIRTTLMTGFPGESDYDFRELLDFMREARFERLGAYGWSPEPGTPAYRLRHRASAELTEERRRLLMKAQAAISRRNLRQLVGSHVEVLMDSCQTGRTEHEAPEIDGIVRLTRSGVQGRFVRAQVVRSTTHDLIADPLD